MFELRPSLRCDLLHLWAVCKTQGFKLRHYLFDPFLAGREGMPDNRSVHRAAAIAVICAFCISSARAVRELVTIDEPQPAQRVEGVVLDPSGAPIPDMTVTDRTEEWVAVLRSTAPPQRTATDVFAFLHNEGRVSTISASITRCSTLCIRKLLSVPSPRGRKSAANLGL